MTRRTVIHNLIGGMVKRTRYETGGLVTYITILVGGYVIVGFSCGGYAVVTFDAASSDTLVIELGTSKGRSIMAHATILSGREMRRISLGVFAGGISSIMTIVTPLGVRYVVMVEYRCRPSTTCNVT